MFQKSIGSVLRCFQFYSNCDPEKDRPSDGLTLQGKHELKQLNQPLNQNFAKGWRAKAPFAAVVAPLSRKNKTQT